MLNRIRNALCGARSAHKRRRRSRWASDIPAAELLENRQLLSAQVVTPSPQNLSISASENVEFQVSYDVEDPAAHAPTGLQLRIHYDSDVLTFASIDNLFSDGANPPEDMAEDVSDGDPNTDRQVNILWVSEDDWPSSASTPLTLLTARFTTASDATDSTVNFTGEAAPVYEFQSSPLEITVGNGSSPAELDRTHGFDQADRFNRFGANEWWLTALNNDEYFIEPDGDLIRWDGTAGSAQGTKIASLGQSVHSDPALLYRAYVSAYEEAGRLDHTLGLSVNGSLFENDRGQSERWLYSDSGKWHYILPNGEFYEWIPGAGLNGTLLATLTPAHYDAPFALANAEVFYLDTEYELHLNGSYYTNDRGQNEKWIRGAYEWYYILPNGEFYQWLGGAGLVGTLIATLDPDFHTHPERLHDEAAGAHLDSLLGLQLNHNGRDFLNAEGLGEKWLKDRAGNWFFVKPNGQIARWEAGSDDELFARVEQRQFDDLHQLYRAAAEEIDRDLNLRFYGSDLQNALGGSEKWMQGHGSQWYYILPNGDIYLWDGIQGQLSGTIVAQVPTSYYDDTSKLYDAHASVVDRELGLHFYQSLYENSGGRGEKWVRGSSGDWYFVLPNGDLHLWDKKAGANGPLVVHIGVEFHAQPKRLHNTRAWHLDRLNSFSSNGNYHNNFGGVNGRWMTNPQNIWFYITDDGNLYQWLGGAATNRQFLSNLEQFHFDAPPTLHDAFMAN